MTYALASRRRTLLASSYELPAMQFHFDAQAITGKSNGDKVTTWVDSSGNGRNATTGGVGPEYRTNVLNGLPALYFDKTVNLVTASVSLAQPTHVFIVAKMEDTGANARLFDGLAGSSRLTGLRQWGGDRKWKAAKDTGSSISLEGELNEVRTKWRVLSVKSNTSSSFVGVNGLQATGTLGSGTWNAMTIGSSYTGTDFYQGYVAEILVTTEVLSAIQVEQVEDYLYRRWAQSPSTAISTPGAALTPSAWATPFNGEHVLERSGSVYTPLFSTSDNIYVTAPVTRSSVQQSRLARLNKSKVAQEDVQLGAGTHNSQEGHRGSSVAASSAGHVFAHPAGHDRVWGGLKTGTVETLSTLAAQTAPTGATAGTNSYWRYHRDPFTGDLWLVLRGDGEDGPVYLWNGTSWDRKAAIKDTAYAGGLGFAAGVVYLTVDRRSTAGHPRENLAVVKSTDNGATWTDLAGTTVPNALDINYTDGTLAFPSPTSNYTTDGGTPVVVDGVLSIIALWHPSTTNEFDFGAAVWQATWNGTSFDRTKVLDGLPDAASLNVSNQNGRIVATTNFNRDAAGDLYLLVSDDGTSWTHHKIAEGRYAGAYIDPNGWQDGVVRLLPMNTSTPSQHQIWEITLP